MTGLVAHGCSMYVVMADPREALYVSASHGRSAVGRHRKGAAPLTDATPMQRRDGTAPAVSWTNATTPEA